MSQNEYFRHQMYNPFIQDIVASMSDEVINQKGITVKWMRNPHVNVDETYVEDRLPELEKAKDVQILIDEPANPISDNPIFAKFGYLQKAHLKFSIAVMEWKRVFGTYRPTEGDIFYIPQYSDYGETNFFKVQFVDQSVEAGWNTLGNYGFVTCTAEKWIYASENIGDTGYESIDANNEAESNDVKVNEFLENEPFAQNLDLLEELNNMNLDREHIHRLATEKSLQPIEKPEPEPTETITDEWVGIKRDKPIDILNKSRTPRKKR